MIIALARLAALAIRHPVYAWNYVQLKRMERRVMAYVDQLTR